MQQEQKRMNILSYLKGYKKECFLSPLFKLLEACFDLTVPLVMAAIINKGIARHDSEYILRYGGVLILLAAGRSDLLDHGTIFCCKGGGWICGKATAWIVCKD